MPKKDDNDTDFIFDTLFSKDNGKSPSISNQIVQMMDNTPKKITSAIISERYSHIKYLKIELYLIDSKVPPLCEYCEAWKTNTIERKWFKQLHRLLNLPPELVSVDEILCDWNCLHADSYIDPSTKKTTYYPMELDQYGENYIELFGMDIEYFPAIKIKLISTRYKEGKKPLELIHSGLGSNTYKELKYNFGNQIYSVKKKTIQVTFLKQLLDLLKSEKFEDNLPLTEKFSDSLGQTHRHISI